ncbi:F-box domain protein [Cooperia oncophora]
MRRYHLLDLPPELIVRILQEFDEQSLGRLRLVSRYLNAIIESHRGALAKQSIYLTVFKEQELVVERYLRRSRWEEYKYAVSGQYFDSPALRQLECANIGTLRFEVTLSDKDAIELAERIGTLKSSVYQVCFYRCQFSPKGIISLLAVLRPQQVTIEFEHGFEGISFEELCSNVSFRKIRHLNFVNSYLTDNDLQLITAEQLAVQDRSNLTASGLRKILLEWYDGRRTIQDYFLTVSGRIIPESLFHNLPTRRRSIISWELRNPNTVLHVNIYGPGVSIVSL